MSNVPSISRGCGYVLTDAGRAAAQSTLSCECVYAWEGLLLICQKCGTVKVRYGEGYLRDGARA